MRNNISFVQKEIENENTSLKWQENYQLFGRQVAGSGGSIQPFTPCTIHSFNLTQVSITDDDATAITVPTKLWFVMGIYATLSSTTAVPREKIPPPLFHCIHDPQPYFLIHFTVLRFFVYHTIFLFVVWQIWGIENSLKFNFYLPRKFRPPSLAGSARSVRMRTLLASFAEQYGCAHDFCQSIWISVSFQGKLQVWINWHVSS